MAGWTGDEGEDERAGMPLEDAMDAERALPAMGIGRVDESFAVVEDIQQ